MLYYKSYLHSKSSVNVNTVITMEHKDILSLVHLFRDLWSIRTAQEDVNYAFLPNCMSLWGNLIHTSVPYYIHHCPTSLVVRVGVIDLNSRNSTGILEYMSCMPACGKRSSVPGQCNWQNSRKNILTSRHKGDQHSSVRTRNVNWSPHGSRIFWQCKSLINQEWINCRWTIIQHFSKKLCVLF